MSVSKDFCSVDAGLLRGMQACSPKSGNFLSGSHLNELAKEKHRSTDLKTAGRFWWPGTLLPGKQRLDVHPKIC